MSLNDLLSSIDSEIVRLQQARELLAGRAVARGKTQPSIAKKSRKKGTLSAEARQRIAEAQRKRWAASKKKAS